MLADLLRDAPYVGDAPVALWVNRPGPYTIHMDRLDAEEDHNGCDPYVESEVLSPLVDLERGEEYSFDVSWHCARIGTASVEKVNSCAVVSRYLRAEPKNNFLRVAASFGVFQTGSVDLVSLCKDGRVSGVQPLGPVTALFRAGWKLGFTSRTVCSASASGWEIDLENYWAPSRAEVDGKQEPSASLHLKSPEEFGD